MSRGGRPGKKGDKPERKCIVTGAVAPKEGLIRFVVGPEGQVVPDVTGKLPGRGMWVTASADALAKAGKKGVFARAAKQQVTVPEDLVAEVSRQLGRRTVDLISLARKSGEAVTGFEKVKDWLTKDVAEVLLQASDGSERGKTKLRPPYGGHHIDWLTAAELGLAFGRQTVIHGALASGGLTNRVVEEALRLKGVRENTVASASGKDKTAR
ncbi:RNA-binding protein [Shimia sp. R11_0]|uniref:RNA-binding protein n=1 Tax=Shimia sp. R11_0 TaxID=2821096 RepID=UPI001ADA992D|nr:RNA-binding protein [Shimia sp. R11_0]MBO9476070.1 RNA-binding protein [Shimia sp. R11_0]